MRAEINPDTYYRLPAVIEILGVAKSTIYRRIRSKHLPEFDRPKYVGTKVVGYKGQTLLAITNNFEEGA